MRFLTTLLAVALVTCLCGTAIASPVEPSGTQATSGQFDARNPDNRAPAAQSATGHPGESAGLAATTNSAADTSIVASTSSGGLSAFLIVLISVGGVAAIGGLAFAASRAVHHHPHGLT